MKPEVTCTEYTVRKVPLTGRDTWIVAWLGNAEFVGSPEDAVGLVKAREVKRKGEFKIGVIEWDNVPEGFVPPTL
jgi:hypothetical protein